MKIDQMFLELIQGIYLHTNLMLPQAHIRPCKLLTRHVTNTIWLFDSPGDVYVCCLLLMLLAAVGKSVKYSREKNVPVSPLSNSWCSYHHFIHNSPLLSLWSG
jgi:hypothetical protein